MFRPRTSQISHEKFSREDVSISDPTSQAVRGGSLRQIPVTGAITPTELDWPGVEWTQRDELVSFPGEIVDKWDGVFNNQPVNTPQTFEFQNGLLDIDCRTGEHQMLYQTGAGRHWYDLVDNAVGWTVEARVQVLTEGNGEHRMVFDDGVHREEITLLETGLQFAYNPALNMAADLKTAPVKMRIGGRQDDIFVVLENGHGVNGANGFTGLSTGLELAFGCTGTDVDSRTLWDEMYQFHHGMWVDSRSTALHIYDTIGSTGITATYYPKRRVNQWAQASLETSGDLLGGTTAITVQYRSNDTGLAWQDMVPVNVNTIGTQNIDLTNVPVAGDASDQLRFKVTQTSTTGAAEAPRVEEITVLTTFTTGAMRLAPNWAHMDGGHMIGAEILDGAEQAAQAAQDPATVDFVTGLYGSTLYQNLALSPTGAGSWDDFATGYESHPNWGSYAAGASPYAPAGPVLQLKAYNLTNSSQTTLPGQEFFTDQVGNGFRYTPTGDEHLKMVVQVIQGECRILQSGLERARISVHDAAFPKEIVVQSDASEMTFEATIVPCTFRVAADGVLKESLGSSTAISGVVASPTASFAADAYLRPLTFMNGAIFEVSRISGNNGWGIGLDQGRPFGWIGDGTNTHTLKWDRCISVDDIHNVAINYGNFGDHTGFELLVNGEVVAHEVTTVTGVSQPAVDLTIWSLRAEVGQVRVHGAKIDAHQFSVEEGLANPAFESRKSWPSYADHHTLLWFAHESGTIRDSGPNKHHPVVSPTGIAGIHRDRQPYNEPAILFWHNGLVEILHSSDLVISLPYHVACRGYFYSSTVTQTVFEKWNADGTIGLSVQVQTDGTVLFTVKDGSTWSVASTVTVDDEGHHAIYAYVDSSGLVLRVDGEEVTLAQAISSIAAATQDAVLGRNLAGYISEFQIRPTGITSSDWDTLRDRTAVKWAPTGDHMFVDGTQVPNTEIIHESHKQKFFRAPAGPAGNVPVYADVHRTSPGVVLPASTPLKYTFGYVKIPTTAEQNKLDSLVGKTLSPFRVLGRVPPHGVGLALLQVPELTVGRNVSLTDLSFKASENLSTYFGGEFALLGGLVTGGDLLYQGQLDTKDIRLSNRSVMRRDVTIPTPLFYRYLLGRGRFYVYQPNALTVDDVKLIRDEIVLLDGAGQQITFERFPWDIEVSSSDVHGNALPTNVFAVTVLTKKPFLKDISVMVRYNAVDSLHGFTNVPNRVEILNMTALMARVGEAPDVDEYSLSLEPTGTWSILVGTTGL